MTSSDRFTAVVNPKCLRQVTPLTALLEAAKDKVTQLYNRCVRCAVSLHCLLRHSCSGGQIMHIRSYNSPSVLFRAPVCRHASDEVKKEVRKSWAEVIKTREFRNLLALANDVMIIWRTGQYVVHHAKVLGQLGLMAQRPCQAAVPFSGRHPVRAPPALAAQMELQSYTDFGQWWAPLQHVSSDCV